MTRMRLVYNELLQRGRRIEFRRVGVQTPGGKVVDRDLVVHNGSVVILPRLDDGSVVLIRNDRYAVGEVLFELPAGTLDDGETPAEAAPRELAEETGYAAGRIEPLGRFYASPGATNEELHAYLATDLAAGAQDLEEYEAISVEVVTDSQLRKMILDGAIRDGKTLATLNLYWLRKRQV